MDRKKNLDYIAYVSDSLSYREKLEAVAEEASELAQAALKLIRACPGCSRNVTQKTLDEALENFREEVLDVMSVLYITADNLEKEKMLGYRKWERWAKRLGYTEDEYADRE